MKIQVNFLSLSIICILLWETYAQIELFPEPRPPSTTIPNNINNQEPSSSFGIFSEKIQAEVKKKQIETKVDFSQFFNSGESRQSKLRFLNKFYHRFQTQPNDPLLQLRKIVRSADGTSNNRRNPLWGSQNSSLIRKSIPKYVDNVSQPFPSIIEPRQISNILGKIPENGMKFQQSGKISMAFTFWGQFIDHDISFTPENHSEQMLINVPWCDEELDNYCEGDKTINFSRSSFVPGSVPRIQVNEVTSWIDGSMVYGSHQSTTNRLRQFQGGKLRASSKNLLPMKRENGHNVFDAGDTRVNENVFLTSFHTAFFREHNRICEILSRHYSRLNDEELFTIAKNYIVALIQKITYKQFLPVLMGKKEFDRLIGSFKGYNREEDPSVATEFSTAGFRIGHSLLVDSYILVNEKKNVVENYLLRNLFFSPYLVNDETIPQLLRGLRFTSTKKKDIKLIDELRNMLINAPGSQMRMDLYSINIQRSKDHGLPSYNKVRKYYGLEPIKNFNQIVKDKDIALQMQLIYVHPDNLDLWVGIIAEDSIQGGILGQLGIEIVGDQFRRLRDADIYWYQNAYPVEIIEQIDDTTFENILVRNIGIESQGKNMFYLVNY